MSAHGQDDFGVVSSSGVSASGDPSKSLSSNAVSSSPAASSGRADAAVIAPPVARGARFKAAAYQTLSRCAYWSPVLVALVLFAQVSFRGLRPSMAEARRLASAEVALGERHDRAAAENREVAAHLAARQDPIFRERQRRLRVIEPPPATPTPPTPTVRDDDGS